MVKLPKDHHNGKGFEMSIIWLVGSTDPWLEELHLVLSGMVATRRILSLKSLARVLAMDGAPTTSELLMILQLDPEDGAMSVYAAMTKFIQYYHPSKICCIGTVSADQKSILDGLRIACIERPEDQSTLARLSRSLLRDYDCKTFRSCAAQEQIQFGDVELDLTSGLLRILATGIQESVTPKEIRILQVLVQSLNDPVARDDLVRKVWPGIRVSTSTVDSHMSRLRKKIDQSFECRIETAYGSGWTLSVRPHLR
jgi:DNA-binding winged helix-turn-helix (wHTH) protein